LDLSFSKVLKDQLTLSIYADDVLIRMKMLLIQTPLLISNKMDTRNLALA
jgi:hypothetical protein